MNEQTKIRLSIITARHARHLAEAGIDADALALRELAFLQGFERARAGDPPPGDDRDRRPRSSAPATATASSRTPAARGPHSSCTSSSPARGAARRT